MKASEIKRVGFYWLRRKGAKHWKLYRAVRSNYGPVGSVFLMDTSCKERDLHSGSYVAKPYEAEPVQNPDQIVRLRNEDRLKKSWQGDPPNSNSPPFRPQTGGGFNV